MDCNLFPFNRLQPPPSIRDSGNALTSPGTKRDHPSQQALRIDVKGAVSLATTSLHLRSGYLIRFAVSIPENLSTPCPLESYFAPPPIGKAQK